MSKQIIGLVRHGLTDWNAARKIQGQTDIPLNEIGRMQAKLLANRLLSEPYRFDAIVSSGMLRAEETARIIGETLDIPILLPEAGLKERAFGLVEGTTPEEREQRWGADWRQLDLGQESDQVLRERAYESFQRVANRGIDSNLLIVTHGAWLVQLFAALWGDRVQEHINNLSYTVLERVEQGWEPVLFNCTKHLQENPV